MMMANRHMKNRNNHHAGFLKLKILFGEAARRAEARHHAKFRKNRRSIRRRDITIYRFLKTAAPPFCILKIAKFY